MSYSKYKDDLPNNTKDKIYNILNNIGISFSIKTTKRMDGIYSSVFEDVNCGWVTCGKGTTKEYCEASALGEAIEHLSNGFAYDSSSLKNSSINAFDFIKYPDEIEKPVEMIKELSPLVYEDLRYTFSINSGITPTDEEIFTTLKNFFGKSTMIFVPYYSLKEKKVTFLPEQIIDNLCGSNGGGAGNTPQEAIGHGIDEIIERYVKHEIYFKRLTPPIIPKEYIRKNSFELAEIIEKIESTNEYKVIVKDASLNQGYPVVAVILINVKNKSYLANFGCHPIFNIALERCLTEMFQFYELGSNNIKRKEMTKWYTVDDELIGCPKNWVSLLKDDVGYIPDSFFYSVPTWEFCEWKQFDKYSNKIGLLSQLDNLKNRSEDIFIRNNSFLGFPVYRTYIPRFSINNLPFDNEHLKCLMQCKEILNNKKNDQFTDLSDFVQLGKTLFNPNMFMCNIIFHNMEEFMSYSLYAALLFDEGSIDKATDILRVQNNKLCSAAIKVIEMRNKNYSTQYIKDLVNLFFDDQEKVFAECWCESNVYLKIYKKYVYPNYAVSKIGIQNSTTNLLNELHISIKKQMLKSKISQYNINKLLE